MPAKFEGADAGGFTANFDLFGAGVDEGAGGTHGVESVEPLFVFPGKVYGAGERLCPSGGLLAGCSRLG